MPGTTGRPVPGYELRLETDDAGAPVQGAGVGALEVRGGSRAAFDPHQRQKSASSIRGEWLATGDRFQRRADGTYEYVGRVDDMLKIGGLWVSPVDIEQVLVDTRRSTAPASSACASRATTASRRSSSAAPRLARTSS